MSGFSIKSLSNNNYQNHDHQCNNYFLCCGMELEYFSACRLFKIYNIHLINVTKSNDTSSQSKN